MCLGLTYIVAWIAYLFEPKPPAKQLNEPNYKMYEHIKIQQKRRHRKICEQSKRIQKISRRMENLERSVKSKTEDDWRQYL